MWFADGMIATPLASVIASAFALIGFAMGCALTDSKWRRYTRAVPERNRKTN